MKKPWTMVAVVIFSLLSLGHLARLALGIQIMVGGREVPGWISFPGMVFPALLAWMLWRERQRP